MTTDSSQKLADQKITSPDPITSLYDRDPALPVRDCDVRLPERPVREKVKSQKSELNIQSSPKVVLVDYRTSNLLSISKAFKHVGAEVELTQDPEEISRADRLVLPGVGSFGAAMRNIETLGMKDALVEFGRSGRPMIGICLGMQLLFTVSFELGIYGGLALIPGEVVAFNSSVKVPHMGWNQVEFRKSSRLFRDLSDGQYAYFVHSYYVRPDGECIAGETDYGLAFASVVERENIFGIQFHPEKSQSFGLKILENFLRV